LARSMIARHIANGAIKMHRDNAFGAFRDLRTGIIDIDQPIIGPTFHEDRFGTGLGDRVDRGDIGKARHEHLITRFQTQAVVAQMKGDRAVAHGNAVINARRLCNRPLEALDIFAQRRDPRRLETVIDIGLFKGADIGLVDGDQRLRRCCRAPYALSLRSFPCNCRTDSGARLTHPHAKVAGLPSGFDPQYIWQRAAVQRLAYGAQTVIQ
jgi:hypothetical protein